MDSKTLMDGIASLNKEDSTMMLVMLKDMELKQLLFSKARGFVNRQKEQLQKDIEVNRKKYIDLDIESLNTKVLISLCMALDIQPGRLETQKNFYDLGDKLIFKTIELLRKTDKKFKGTSFQDLIQHQTFSLFTNLSVDFSEGNIDPDKQEKIITEVFSFIEPETVM